MYPYLPEMMRNPETFEMLLTNPMYKDQLKGIMQQMKAGGGGEFGPQEGMPDVNSPEVQEQFAAMGMTPQDAIQKLMGDPELAMAFQNPKIQHGGDGLLLQPEQHREVPERPGDHGRCS